MSNKGSGKRKDALLGSPHGTANARLRKAILFKYVQLAGHDICFRCARKIDSVNDLSIEHKESWQLAANPVEAFYDLGNVAFSHLRCNVSASDKSRLVSRHTGKTHCVNGHEFDPVNTYVQDLGNGKFRRDCRACLREKLRRFRAVNPSYGRGAVQVVG